MSTPVPTAVLDPQETVSRYLSTWNARDPDARARLLDRHWASDAVYVDPLVDVAGREAISAVIEEVQRRFDGMQLSLVGQPEVHHRHLRFQWGLGPEGEEAVVVGSDVAFLDDQGRFLSVVGFLDLVPG